MKIQIRNFNMNNNNGAPWMRFVAPIITASLFCLAAMQFVTAFVAASYYGFFAGVLSLFIPVVPSVFMFFAVIAEEGTVFHPYVIFIMIAMIVPVGVLILIYRVKTFVNKIRPESPYAEIDDSQIDTYQQVLNEMFLYTDVDSVDPYEGRDRDRDEILSTLGEKAAVNFGINKILLICMYEQYVQADPAKREDDKDRWVELMMSGRCRYAPNVFAVIDSVRAAF